VWVELERIRTVGLAVGHHCHSPTHIYSTISVSRAEQ
jgi:hypothetical protein